MSIVDKILKDLGPPDKRIKEIMTLINSGDYSISIDIVSRSRELALLYAKVKDYKKAIGILNIMIDFCYKTEGLNEFYFISKDVKKLITLHKKRGDKKSVIKLLETMIERYPDYTFIANLEDQLKEYQNK